MLYKREKREKRKDINMRKGKKRIEKNSEENSLHSIIQKRTDSALKNKFLEKNGNPTFQKWKRKFRKYLIKYLISINHKV